MWEHIDGLNLGHFILLVHQLQVASLCGWVTAHIHDALWCCVQDGLYYVWMHTCAGGVGDDDIWTTMFCNEVICQDVLHVASIEQRVLDAVCLRVDLGVLDGFRYLLDTNHLLGFLVHEVGDGARTGIEVVDEWFEV